MKHSQMRPFFIFGFVLIVTLALRTSAAAATLTWTGAVDMTWSNGANWTGGNIPTSVDDAIIPNNFNVNLSGGDFSVLTLTVGTNTILTIASGSSLTIEDGTNNGTIAGAGTLNFIGSSLGNNGTISVAAVNANVGANPNKSLTGSGSFVGNLLTIESGVTFALQSNHQFHEIDAQGDFDATSQTISLRGPNPLQGAGGIITASSTFVFDGTTAQTVSREEVDFNNLTINNAAGVTFNERYSVNGMLNLENGLLNIGPAGALDLLNNATVTRTNGYMLGDVTKASILSGGSFTFPVGTANGYSPVTVHVTDGETRFLTVKAVQENHPELDPATSLRRYWSFFVSTGHAFTANVTFNYLQGDVSGNESDYRLTTIRHFGDPPIVFANNCAAGWPCVNTTANTAFMGKRGFGGFLADWTLSELEPTPNTPTGSNVLVETGDAMVTFADVSVAGTTTFTPVTVNSSQLPPGYTPCATCPAYDIATTASYSAPVTACLAVPAGIDQQAYTFLKLMHLENSAFVDRTTGNFTDPGGLRFVCGVVQSLSQFALASGQAPTAAPAGIRGQIARADGAPVSGVVVQLGGAQTRKTITDTNGNYRFDNVETGGFYTVTPSRVNYTFSPSSRSFSQIGETTEAAFSATATGQNANPLDTPEYFVSQHYLDFLGREPDERGFNFWSDQMLECGADAGCLERRRVNVSAAYFLSIEFQETGGLVDGLYRASYGRAPRYAEFMPDVRTIAEDVIVGEPSWEQHLVANREAFVQAWVQRTAFRQAYDSLSNDTYVNRLISHTGVSFDESERDALVSSLNAGASTRANVLMQIVVDERFVSAKRNERFVMMQYFGYLRRDPDESGYQFWLAKLNQFNGNFEQAEMVKAFIVSGEYRQRFGP